VALVVRGVGRRTVTRASGDAVSCTSGDTQAGRCALLEYWLIDESPQLTDFAGWLRACYGGALMPFQSLSLGFLPGSSGVANSTCCACPEPAIPQLRAPEMHASRSQSGMMSLTGRCRVHVFDVVGFAKVVAHTSGGRRY
jgi:hypothetical protein